MDIIHSTSNILKYWFERNDHRTISETSFITAIKKKLKKKKTIVQCTKMIKTLMSHHNRNTFLLVKIYNFFPTIIPKFQHIIIKIEEQKFRLIIFFKITLSNTEHMAGDTWIVITACANTFLCITNSRLIKWIF